MDCLKHKISSVIAGLPKAEEALPCALLRPDTYPLLKYRGSQWRLKFKGIAAMKLKRICFSGIRELQSKLINEVNIRNIFQTSLRLRLTAREAAPLCIASPRYRPLFYVTGRAMTREN